MMGLQLNSKMPLTLRPDFLILSHVCVLRQFALAFH